MINCLHLKNNFIIVCLIFFTSSCRLSTSELEREVKLSISETLREEGAKGVKIKHFSLTHIQGNEYSGFLETTINGHKYNYFVDVLYDGENFQWEIIE